MLYLCQIRFKKTLKKPSEYQSAKEICKLEVNATEEKMFQKHLRPDTTTVWPEEFKLIAVIFFILKLKQVSLNATD